MLIYLAGGTGKPSAKVILDKGRRLISYYDIIYADRSFYIGYEIEWYIGKKIHGTKRKEVKP